MTTRASGWWTAPTPRSYRSRPAVVSALPYDGTTEAASAVQAWLDRSPTRPTRLRMASIGQPARIALTIEQPHCDPLTVTAGDVLVLRGSTWQTIPTHEFDAEFELRPREMPIYDNGE